MQVTIRNENPLVQDDITDRVRAELAGALLGQDDRIARIDVELRPGSAHFPTGEVHCVLEAQLREGPCIVAGGRADSPVVAAVAAAGKLGCAVRYYVDRIDAEDHAPEAA
jgi:hypothetical protein